MTRPSTTASELVGTPPSRFGRNDEVVGTREIGNFLKLTYMSVSSQALVIDNVGCKGAVFIDNFRYCNENRILQGMIFVEYLSM